MNSLMYKKLNKTLINDKKLNTHELEKIINSEFSLVLQEYACVLPDTQVNFNIDDKGNYILNYSAKITRIKNFGVLK